MHPSTFVRVTEANSDFTSVYRSFTMFANMMRSLPLHLDALPWARLALPLSLSLIDFNLQRLEKNQHAIFALRFQWGLITTLFHREFLPQPQESSRRPS